MKLFSNIYQGTALAILEKYNNPEKLSKAHNSSLSSMIHGKCSTKAVDIITAAKHSVGIKSEHLYFQINQAINRLKNISAEIEEYNEQIKYYVDLINTNILTIPGISYITAGLILGEIGDIARFKNADHLVSFAGLDVIVYESGKYKAKNLSISKKGSKYLRYALYQAAKVCWMHDPMFNKYYLKKKAENKHYYVILGHLEKKLIKVIYSILKEKDKKKTYSPQI